MAETLKKQTPEEVAFDYANRKRAIANAMLQYREDIEDLTNHVKRVEMKTTAEIAGEVDGAGKPLYSNDAKRKAELDLRLAEDEGYQENVTSLSNAKHHLGVSTTDWEYQSDMLAIVLKFS